MAEMESEWFTSDPTIRNRCNECANNHARNIHGANDPTGPHVGAIQGALIVILGPTHGISKAEMDTRTYGKTTAMAVWKFKNDGRANGTGKPILGPGQTTPDHIVGKQTIVALDQRMKTLLPDDPPPPPPAPIPPPEEPPSENKLPQDIFIYFRGAPPAQQGTDDTEVQTAFEKEFNTEAYKKTHQPVKAICIFGGRGATDKSDQVIAQVVGIRAANKTGVTIVRGDSVGALTALKAAAKLTQKGIKLDYVAIDDGAFFDRDGEITSTDPLKIKMPGAIVATKKDNFFQTFQHEVAIHPSTGKFAEGTEFHGPLEGFHRNQSTHEMANTKAVINTFNSIPLTSSSAQVRFRTGKIYGPKAHDAAHKDADPEIDAIVKSLIKP